MSINTKQYSFEELKKMIKEEKNKLLNLDNYSNALKGFYDFLSDIWFSCVNIKDVNQLQTINTMCKNINKQLLKLLDKDNFSSYEDKLNLTIQLKWDIYIEKYNNCLETIKKYIFEAVSKIKEIKNYYQNFFENIIYDFEKINNLIAKYESFEKVIACTLIRRIIEIILELKIYANKEHNTCNFKIKNIQSYFDFFKKNKIDWGVKTIILKKSNDSEIHYFVDELWKDEKYLKKEVYQKLLSDNIHYKINKNVYIDYIDILTSSYKFNNYIIKKISELADLEELLNRIYITLADQIIVFENGELFMIVEDFMIVNYSTKNYYFGGDLRCNFICDPNCTDEELKYNAKICEYRETKASYKKDKESKRFYSDYKNIN